jgi:hypothetical protein
MGNAFVGTIHPCKIYNILGVGAPVLYIGPKPSHIADIFAGMGAEARNGTAQHGEAEAVVRVIRSIAAAQAPPARRAQSQTAGRFSKAVLLGQVVSELESGEERKGESRKQKAEMGQRDH